MKHSKSIKAAFAVAGVIVCMAWGVRTVASGLVRPVETGWHRVASSLCARLGGLFDAQATAVRNKELEREIALLKMVRADNENLRAPS